MEKESPKRDKREGQEKAPKSYEIGAIGEGCESKKMKLLGMRARTRGKLRRNDHPCGALFGGTISRLRE